MAYDNGADTVVVDSLKDAFLGISEDGPAAGYNRARQAAIAAGVQLAELHHMRKNSSGGGKPESLADVYGSAWITAGSGSVIALNGNPGDPLVEWRHLKQPAGVVGPWKVLHNQITGESIVHHAADLVSLAGFYPDGLSAKDAAKVLFETDKPSPNEVEKARRRIEALERSGLLVVVRHGDKTANQATLWGATPNLHDLAGGAHDLHAPFTVAPRREGFTNPSHPSRRIDKTAGQRPSRQPAHPSRPRTLHAPPP